MSAPQSDDDLSGGCRVLVLGAHPDDAEVFAGGLLIRHCQNGASVRIVSVTDGRSGHHEIAPEKLVGIRRKEAAAAGARVGAEYITWDFHDGSLEPNLKVREAIIREIRNFNPSLLLTHRPNDYHPDHRAVGVAVQDASYLVTVPHICPDVTALRRDPVVAYMADLFTRPDRLRVDVALKIDREFDLCVQMAACHQSQFFEWLAYHDGVLDSVPPPGKERYAWLSARLAAVHRQRVEHFRAQLPAEEFVAETKTEVYEISEYARELTPEFRDLLFPGAISTRVSR